MADTSRTGFQGLIVTSNHIFKQIDNDSFVFVSVIVHI